jgi:probable rRNA maturation factor
MGIDVRVESGYSGRVDREALRRVARKALRAENASPANLTLVIVGDKKIRELNRQFHRVNAPTDVLSFASDQDHYLGDVIISYETARENARRAGWRLRDELQLLVVHGVLHLLGYDDTRPRARVKMWQKQREILGMSIPQSRYACHFERSEKSRVLGSEISRKGGSK